ncbi:hypothetical protein V8G54_017322 [Vigna mungo]|uniref:Decapping nuclease n=1 Tax=Vigna mungo TaxID=3915 RepID=A0AAQ3NPA1_VIGMU
MSLEIRCYVGYCFESLATEDPRRADGEGIHHVDANVEFCSVIKTKLGAHRILMGAEMDCCDSTNDGKRFYVELKTSCEDLDEDYILQFAPPFNRLELLQAQSCPDVIASHLELL